MDVAAGGERAEHVEVAAREPREAEQRDPRGQLEQPRLGDEPLAGRPRALRRARPPEPHAQPPPQLRLPARLVRQVDDALRPAADDLRPVQRVAVEQAGDVADGGEPPRAARLVVALAEVHREAAQPRLAEALVDDLQQRPHRALRQPRVGVRLDARGDRDGVAQEHARERELDVRADPVGAPRRRAEAARELLRQPALHAARRHADHLGRERVRRRRGEQPGERPDQAVGAFCPVDVEHPMSLSIRADGVRRYAASAAT